MINKDKIFRVIADDMEDLNMVASVITGCLDREPNGAHISVETNREEHKEELESFLEDFFLYEDTGATYKVKVV